MSSAEMIANTIRRLRTGLVTVPKSSTLLSHPESRLAIERSTVELMKVCDYGEVVDITALFRDYLNNDTAVDLYAQVMRPLYKEATYCYVSEPGEGGDASKAYISVIGMSAYERGDADWERFYGWQPQGTFPAGYIEMDTSHRDPTRWQPKHVINWDTVRWILCGTMYADVPGNAKCAGPIISWRFAVTEEGQLLDIHWLTLTDEVEMWDNALSVLLLTHNWLNCRNVELAVPKRDRPHQRRIDRHGVQVKEVHVRPVGRTVQGSGGTVAVGGAVPLHTVRGHIARYGVEGRKPLFGKITGRFWIPAHARGSKEAGERHTTKVVDT